jgi:small subunit ribosomal protein S21
MSKYWKRNAPISISGLRVEVKDGNFEKALRQFNKKVNDSGKLKEVRDREEFLKPSVHRRRAKQNAVKRTKKESADRKVFTPEL